MSFHSRVSHYEPLNNGGEEDGPEHPAAEEDCIDNHSYPLGLLEIEYLLSKSEGDKGKNVVYKRNWCCGIKCRKERDLGWNDKRVKNCKDFMQAKLSYDMYEDIHQVANYC